VKRATIATGLTLLALFLGFFLLDPGFWLRYGQSQFGLPIPDAWTERPRRTIDATPVQEPPSPAQEALRAIFQSRGLEALVVDRAGATVFEAYAAPTTRETPRDGGKLTRWLPVLLTGALLADETLPGYDAVLGDWIAGFATAAPQPLRLLDVLTDATGLSQPRMRLAPFAAGTQFVHGSDIAAALEHWPRTGEAGCVREENPVHAQILLRLIETARGEDFASLFARRLWRPLGAGPASFALDRTGGTVLAHCCFAARAIDWVRLAGLPVERGRRGPILLLPAQFLEDMAKPAVDPRFGMGIRRLGIDFPGLPADTITIEGGAGQLLAAIPSRAVAVAVFGMENAEEQEVASLLRAILSALP
jgi:CubicO group peptidase (beta-lactamase class C family)